MGYRGKIAEQNRAKELRAKSWTLLEIATELGVAKSSVSLWVRDVEFTPNPRRTARRREPNRLQLAKAAEIERCRTDGIARIGSLSDREFLMAGLVLCAGDGAKREGMVSFANSNPQIIHFFCSWFREFFEVEEARLRVMLYLHDGLDLAAANTHWEMVTGIPSEQFTKPYRAVPKATIRHNKHRFGCAHVRYSSTHVHRQLMGLMNALLYFEADNPG